MNKITHQRQLFFLVAGIIGSGLVLVDIFSHFKTNRYNGWVYLKLLLILNCLAFCIYVLLAGRNKNTRRH